jgi:ADP-ribosylglycohydrolase
MKSKRAAAILASSFNVIRSEAVPSLHDRIEGAFFGTLVADALCLGSHYEYDARVIKKAYGGIIPRYMAPGEMMGSTTHGVGWGRRNYHPGQKAGDQTDYGQYSILALEYFANRPASTASNPVNLEELIPVWKQRVTSPSWGAWVCTMTKTTLQQVDAGSPFSSLGGMSNAMSIRHASSYAVYNNEDAVVDAALKLMFTHRNGEALGGSEFFARVAFRVIHKGLKPMEAIKEVASEMSPWFEEKANQGLNKCKEAMDPNSALYREEFQDDLAMTSMARLWDVGKTEPIKVGKASPTEGTLPSSVYIICKYENDLIGALKANAMVGGDNAARSVAIGLVLGSYHGVAAIPAELKEGLNAWAKTEKLLRKLPLLKDRPSEEL